MCFTEVKPCNVDGEQAIFLSELGILLHVTTRFLCVPYGKNHVTVTYVGHSDNSLTFYYSSSEISISKRHVVWHTQSFSYLNRTFGH